VTTPTSPLCAEFHEIVARLESLALTPMEQTILYELVNDIEDRLSSVKRLDGMVKARIAKEKNDRAEPLDVHR